MRKSLWLIGLLIVTVSLAGCLGGTSGGDKGTTTQSLGKVRGFVSDGQGGPAVADATVTWNGSKAYTTKTNEDGEFLLAIPAGETADLIVERPDGGATRVQALQVAEDEELTIDIPTRRAFNPEWSMNPPTVKLNIEPDQLLEGIVDLKVEFEGDNDAYVLYVYVGTEIRAPREGMIIEANELELSIDTSEYENGRTYIRVLAYDENENAVIYTVPVRIYNQAPWNLTAPGIVPLMAVYADTYAENIGYYSKQALIEVQQRQNRMAVADLNAAPPDSMLMSTILWIGADGADGYKVYRSFDAVNYRQIATVSASKGPDGIYQVGDYSPQLAPGKRTWYKVVPYNSVGEGPATVVDVTPLPPMDIYLVSPANGATDVELEPTFTWELRTKDQFPEDTYIEYLFTLFDATNFVVEAFSVIDSEEATLSAPLNPGHVYTWNIGDSYAERLCADGPTGYSYAYSYGGLAYGDTDTGSRNGEFVFTTTTEIED